MGWLPNAAAAPSGQHTHRHGRRSTRVTKGAAGTDITHLHNPLVQGGILGQVLDTQQQLIRSAALSVHAAASTPPAPTLPPLPTPAGPAVGVPAAVAAAPTASVNGGVAAARTPVMGRGRPKAQARFKVKGKDGRPLQRCSWRAGVAAALAETNTMMGRPIMLNRSR